MKSTPVRRLVRAFLTFAGNISSASAPAESSSAPCSSMTATGLNGADIQPAVPLNTVTLSPASLSRMTIVF